jgi:multidrug efflux system membrane fusion protein
MKMPFARTSLLSVALLLAVSAGCSKPKPRPQPKTTVSVATATVTAVPFTVQSNGTVEPIQSVAVQPQVGGVVVRVAFNEGEEVQQGQVLFQIDPRPFQAALSQSMAILTRDQVQADNSEREAARYASLVQQGYVTQSQADQLRATAAAQRAVVIGDQASVDVARLNLSYATIRAPISGRTGSLLVKAGNVIRTPNPTPLVVINQIQPVQVRFTVPDRILGDLQRAVASPTGLGVRATPTGTDSLGNGVVQLGTLRFLDNAVDTTTGAISLKASFANTARTLWPGQFVTVTLDLYNQTNALTVPTAAVQAGQQGSYVYVVDKTNHARLTPVTVSRTAGEVAIISEGLEPGSKVVIDGQARLSPGSEVVIRGPGAPNGGRTREKA